MSAYHLGKPEIQSELKIGGQSIDGTAEGLRKQLTKCLKTDREIKPNLVSELDMEESFRVAERNIQTWQSLFESKEISRILRGKEFM